MIALLKIMIKASHMAGYSAKDLSVYVSLYFVMQACKANLVHTTNTVVM